MSNGSGGSFSRSIPKKGPRSRLTFLTLLTSHFPAPGPLRWIAAAGLPPEAESGSAGQLDRWSSESGCCSILHSRSAVGADCRAAQNTKHKPSCHRNQVVWTAETEHMQAG